ncbi:sugar transferase [Halodesulfovibrio marinisediminis]|uniref:Sugar transferase involved in LPS biosynthesis (Colanic, teichoic acid) n=1 Tax=Halodesulfovibrio marinisediminis DSM 17456 TaxID=1121457 RepID=A0A1N6FSX6_9BACT|nr:sugar transferase [Halodesulfovibrio marinisediminis]SIN98340.1 Sugar transferase involved in LPS biosynthesis (colanic, teichoic acid) [Halodesulfovibrio marinisediminis DSM 17456]
MSLKRIFDVIFAVVLLAVVFPLFIVIACLIRKDGGSAFFRQERVGLDGRPFQLYKFRSMVINAESLGGYSTQANDPRITSVGQWLRKTSIDELPQLLNVLKGDMSFVGPRPNVPAQKEEYTEEQWNLRNSVIPGITGLAQAKVRSQGTWKERYDFDMLYIQNRSFMYDLWILVLTARTVLCSKGAN